MSAGDGIGARLDELEIKASLTEDALDRLNDVVIRQQAQIDSLLRALARLERERAGAPDDGAAPRSPRDEVPPHY
jgi:SlyX protein